MKIKNALSIDVEDYFQVSAFENVVERNSWEHREHRVERNIDTVLAMLAEFNIKATFFTLGWIAEKYPRVVGQLVKEGHELASHGYGHERVWDLTPDEFKADVIRTKKLLEDLGGVAVQGYRAPSFSIGKQNVWALQVLAETGHIYSSSIYPGNHDQYGYPGAPRFVFRDENSGIIEIPITTYKIFDRLVPAAGGGFFRLYPYWISRQFIENINAKLGESAVFYFHPWELDPEQPRQKCKNFKTQLRHYLNLDKTEGRLLRLFGDFDWGRIDEVFVARDQIPVMSLK